LLFEGTKRLLEVADERVPMQVEARCWCGERATHNARLVNGDVVYEGDVVVVGDTAPGDPALFGDVVTYQLLCRRHWRSGRTH
jgi:thymidine kinase